MIVGLPDAKSGPAVELETFYKYIPNLKSYVEANKDIFNMYNEKCRTQLNYTYWGNDWEFALSLAIAHYMCITNPSLPQGLGNDSAAGGVMSSRSVDKINYSYDTSKYMSDHQSAHFWNLTGYGRTLFTLSEARGYIGMFIGV